MYLHVSVICRLVAMAGVSAAVLVLVLAFFQVAESAGLVYDYYAKTCPDAEKIIKDTVYRLYEKKGNIATSLIRMEFHDCFNVLSTHLMKPAAFVISIITDQQVGNYVIGCKNLV